ncbi:alanyl-tRNA editing protein [Candidatus Bathyarchaeota archaeon]|nr:alanyl-tRNA editing protein [Candidatus Bathyarchaeota archaeon]
MDVEIRTHTAIHVVKGAIVKVLGDGARWSASAAADGSHGRIAVQFDRKPTEDEVREIERQANLKVEEDQPIEIHRLSREEAEARWGDYIYDLFPLPEHIRDLSVFHLPGWNVNTCAKEHTESTGQVGRITISKARYRNSKGLLEVSFNVE